MKGDGIYNPAWRPRQPIEFALIGNMDIDGDGKDDRETLETLIADRGGRVTFDLPPTGKTTGELTLDTRWLVIGEGFDAIDQGGVLQSKAKSLGISRIKLDKLMGWLNSTKP